MSSKLVSSQLKALAANSGASSNNGKKNQVSVKSSRKELTKVVKSNNINKKTVYQKNKNYFKRTATNDRASAILEKLMKKT